MKALIIIVLLISANLKLAFSQDTTYARKIINDLTSIKMYGRGYVNNGGQIASKYLTKIFKENKLKPLNGKLFTQTFKMSVNTFPDKMDLSVNGKKLISGVHFIVSPESSGISGQYFFVKKDSITFLGKGGDNKTLVVKKAKKLTWSVAPESQNYCAIELLNDSFPKDVVSAKLDIKNKVQAAYKAQNICGFIEGKNNPDSFLVITAHYDHLGMMGKDAIFPGANDNASGVSMLLSLMRHYGKQENNPDISIVFICFAGEEAGLKGSEHFVNHPLIPLSKIKFLLNLDLLGTGDEGITVVNATEHNAEFERLKTINEEKKYLALVKPRGKAKNSDHYYFSEKGVKAFFIYTMGGIKAYHDVHDISKTLPLTKYTACFYLISDFLNSFSK